MVKNVNKKTERRGNGAVDSGRRKNDTVQYIHAAARVA